MNYNVRLVLRICICSLLKQLQSFYSGDMIFGMQNIRKWFSTQFNGGVLESSGHKSFISITIFICVDEEMSVGTTNLTHDITRRLRNGTWNHSWARDNWSNKDESVLKWPRIAINVTLIVISVPTLQQGEIMWVEYILEPVEELDESQENFKENC